MVSWAKVTQKMLQGKPINKIADFRNIFTLCNQQLIFAKLTKKFRGEVSLADLKVYDDIIILGLFRRFSIRV